MEVEMHIGRIIQVQSPSHGTSLSVTASARKQKSKIS